MPSLHQQAALVRNTSTAALTLTTRLLSLESIPRRYVAEMIVIRIFALFEALVEDSACRLICGAKYCDGSAPSLERSRPTQGFERARSAMRLFGRCDPHNLLRWNKASEIKRNLECLFPANEHFIEIIIRHGRFISDLRKVRNHIAHCNAGTRRKFEQVKVNYYGASVKSITPGRFLLSSRFSPIVLEQFCRTTKILLLEAIKG